MVEYERVAKLHAGATRRALARLGDRKLVVIRFLYDANGRDGFCKCIELGRPELTFECLVCAFPGEFSEDIVAKARRELRRAGVDVEVAIRNCLALAGHHSAAS
ncbi:hypothetical protein GGQ86_002994 [Xanthobacter flavus]|uniref:Uncharacterized protein n=1 Tax=Xanthobacter flavus TaxID=281 RepID=A0ABU1KI44_XANFL|nr:hypothetical protein [Xanthobacter flavus]MDR6334512.1 hypothetical protein [Xanthobacter flavus]